MFHSILRGGSLFAALMISTAAHGALTAEQVWANWKTLNTFLGQTVTAASETREGDTLVIKGVEVVSAFVGGSARGTIDTMNLRELGDGRVEVVSSPDYPTTVNMTDSDGKTFVSNVIFRQPDLKMIVSGSDAEMIYDYSASSIKVEVNNPVAEEEPDEFDLDVDLTGVAGKDIVTAGASVKVVSSFSADSAGFTLVMTDPQATSTVNLKGSFNALAGTANLNMLGTAATDSFVKALEDGFTADGTFTYGAGTLEFDAAEAADTTKGTATIGSGSVAVGLSAEQMSYGGGAKDVAMTVSGSTIPVPSLGLSYAETAFNLSIPFSKSDVPGDFAFLTKLIDFKLSDDVWALFDPGSVLPRDPATIVIDTKGKLNWLVDIMDPFEAAKVDENSSLAQFHALDVTELRLKAAGAEVTGTGAFTFDNSDTTTFPGMPMPTGQLDLKIVGTNGLLDRLVQMGLLPEDQAMGARMMMGLFAKTVEGSDDTLTSTLEFKDKGFFANGQRLQ